MFNHLNITLYGQVQGVFLRRTVAHEAERKGIFGFVKNMPDGTVYIEVEGTEEVLNQLVAWLKAGASAGGDYKISQVEVSKGQFKAFSGFEIQ